MARRRNIDPGFFRNEDLGECSPLARLLFAGLWCWADRRGRLEDRPRRLKAEVLPYDRADGEKLVAELIEHGFLRRYNAAGVQVLEVVNFARHQRPHPREEESTLPGDDGGFAEGAPEANPGFAEGAPEASQGEAIPVSLSRSLDPSSLDPGSSDTHSSLARRARTRVAESVPGGRAGGQGVRVGVLSGEVLSRVSAGLGFALAPFTRQAEADEFEQRIARFGRGAEEAVEYFAATCRKRRSQPESAVVLLLMLRDLDPTAAGGAR